MRSEPCPIASWPKSFWIFVTVLVVSIRLKAAIRRAPFPVAPNRPSASGASPSATPTAAAAQRARDQARGRKERPRRPGAAPRSPGTRGTGRTRGGPRRRRSSRGWRASGRATREVPVDRAPLRDERPSSGFAALKCARASGRGELERRTVTLPLRLHRRRVTETSSPSRSDVSSSCRAGRRRQRRAPGARDHMPVTGTKTRSAPTAATAAGADARRRRAAASRWLTPCTATAAGGSLAAARPAQVDDRSSARPRQAQSQDQRAVVLCRARPARVVSFGAGRRRSPSRSPACPLAPRRARLSP